MGDLFLAMGDLFSDSTRRFLPLPTVVIAKLTLVDDSEESDKDDMVDEKEMLCCEEKNTCKYTG